jgi:hypothetical protein
VQVDLEVRAVRFGKKKKKKPCMTLKSFSLAEHSTTQYNRQDFPTSPAFRCFGLAALHATLLSGRLS